jgi:hypothetical protein
MHGSSLVTRSVVVVVVVLAVAVGGFFGYRALFADDDPRASGERAELYFRRACDLPPEWIQRIDRGYRQGQSRADDIVIVPKPPNYVGGFETTSHSGPYDFLQEVPLVLYGPGVVEPQGRVDVGREVTLADLGPTYGHVMGFEFTPGMGRPITEVFPEQPEKPALILHVVLDGAGWNALEQWPNAWPNLARMIEEGVNVDGAIVGSSPSVTPATHTNMSTGDFPRKHGVMAILVRKSSGKIVGGFTKDRSYAGSKTEPDITLRIPTLADVYDKAMGNDPLIGTVTFGNYSIGMMGQGSAFEGGDKDLAAFEEHRGWATDRRWYYMPDYLNSELPGPEGDIEATDLMDGEADGLWRSHRIFPLDATPALAPYQTRAIEAIVDREGFGDDEITDLLYVNFKSPDMAGHRWNMINPEQKDVLRSVDGALGELDDFLQSEVGTGNFMIAVTADHGQTPLEVGGWAIDRLELLDDLQKRFDKTKNSTGLVELTSPTVLFMNKDEMRVNDVRPEDISTFLSAYTLGQNVGSRDGDEVPEEFAGKTGQLIFDGVFPGGKIPEISKCAGVSP